MFSLGASPAGIAVIGEGHRRGRLHHISSGGAVMAGTPQQLGGLSIAGRLIHGVAVGDQGIHTKVAVLALQSADIVVVQSLENRPTVGIAVLHQVAGGVLNGVLGSRRAGGDVVPHTLDGALSLAAARGELGSQIVEALLGVIAQLAHSVVHAMEAVANSGCNVTLAVLQAVKRESFVDVSPGRPALAGRGAEAAAAVIAAPAVAPAPAAEHAEDQEKDNPGRPIAAPHAGTVAARLISRRNGHRDCCVIAKRHFVFPPFFYIQNRGHGF